MNTLNITIIDGYWNLNEKPLKVSSYAEKCLFSHYLRMKTLKLPISRTASFKHRKAEIKAKFNYKFTCRKTTSDFLEFPNMENLIFERKTA